MRLAPSSLARYHSVLFRGLLLALLLVCDLAWAQSGEETAGEQIAAEALRLYRGGQYEQAAARFLEAFAFSGRATQLNNAAKAFERAGRKRDALDAWRRYVELGGVDGARRARAMEQIKALEAELGSAPPKVEVQQLPDATEVPKVKPSIAEPPKNEIAVEPITDQGTINRGAVTQKSALSWAMIISGSAVLLGGGGLYLSGWLTFFDFDDGKPVTFEQGQRARLRSGVGIGMMAAGAVALLVGIFWPDEEPLTVTPSQNGAALSW